jgi:hypothetical protein
MDAGLLAVVHDDPRSLLATVLERVEAIVDQIDHVAVAVDPEEAALLMKAGSFHLLLLLSASAVSSGSLLGLWEPRRRLLPIDPTEILELRVNEKPLMRPTADDRFLAPAKPFARVPSLPG